MSKRPGRGRYKGGRNRLCTRVRVQGALLVVAFSSAVRGAWCLVHWCTGASIDISTSTRAYRLTAVLSSIC